MDPTESGRDNWAPIGESVSTLVSSCLSGHQGDQPSADLPTQLVAAGGEQSVTPCRYCGGAGYYTEAVAFGHPHFGVLFPCVCKLAEQEQRVVEELQKLSNLNSFRDKTFDRFDPNVPGVRRAYLRTVEYAQRPQGWLVLFGGYGTGKTHLAAAIATEVLRHQQRVIFAVVPDLLDHLRATFGPDSPVAYDDRFEMIREVGLLILDDLGTENTTSWAREKLYQLINHRYNDALPTVITSNLDPEAIDPRIFSRMCDPALCREIIRINAGDYRKRQMKALREKR
jgi:DNA replication protein DnaC